VANITSTGIGSGIDVNSLVSQLVAAERAPIDKRLTNTDAKLTAQLTAVSSLKGALGTLQASANSLKGNAAFDLRKATVGDEAFFSAAVTSDAVAGHYDVEVVQLATATRLSSSGFPVAGGGASTVVGTGTLAINVGAAQFNVTIDATNNTLAKIRDAINSSADNKGARATLITDQDGTHLVLTGTKTGAANAVSINLGASVDSDGDANDAAGLSRLFGLAPKDPLNDVAKDAIVKVSGFEIHSDKNTIDGAIDGVTLVLKKANASGETNSLDIARDDASILSKAQGFVTAFNALAKQVSTLGAYNAATKTGGALLGDSLLRGVDSQVRRIISDPVTGATGAYTTLASLGITTNADGTLALDSAKFQKALNADPLSVNKVFTSETGVAARLGKFLDQKLSATGEFATRTSSLDASQKSLTKEREALDARMLVIQQRYMQQFTALDSMLASLQSTSSMLTQQLQGLSNLANGTNSNS
jgi:flagellar hook-associated protein 2